MSNLIDTYLGQYHLIEVINRGGMATVYKAHQPSLDRYVAVKVLRHDHDPQFGARFKREAWAIAQLQHPHILPIYDYGEQGDVAYLVLQYIEDGTTLADLLGTPCAPGQALRLTIQLLSGLEYAHARGIIHRDIKPANVLLSGMDRVLLADFGIAKMLNEGQQHLTMPGLIIGTAAYMAPEQATGQPVDARTDLYAAGVVLYEMLTGQVPFEADTPIALLNMHAYEPPPPPRRLNPDLPVEIEAVVLRALAKDPGDRFQSAAEMAATIDAALAQIERPNARRELADLYESGLLAFEEGRWDEALERLSRLVALDPGYEDAGELLAAARVAQERARAAARQQIDLVRQRRQSGLYQRPGGEQDAAGAGPAVFTPPSPPAPQATNPAPAERPSRADGDQPRRRRRIKPAEMIYLGVALGLVVALSRLIGIWPDQPAPTSLAGSTARATAGIPTATASVPTAGPPTPPAPTAVAALPAPAGALVHEDDFSDGPDQSGLEDQVGATDFSRGFHAPGVYHIRLSQPNETRLVLLPRFAQRDFSVQLDLWDESDSFAGSAAQGLIFRARDRDHFYALLLDPRAGRYSVGRQDGPGTWVDLVAWKESALIKRQTEVNRLRVDAAGDMFTFYLNGAPLDTLRDETLAGLGMVGLIAANVDADKPHLHFDNVAIWNADVAPPPGLELTRDTPTGAMALIPGGEFILGGNERTDAPAHIVALPNFYIDRTEVTNTAYAACVQAGDCTLPQSAASATRQGYAGKAEFAGFPVVQVGWEQARGYCAWAGKRLPTEAEWEKAASWSGATGEKLAWPLGRAFDPALLNSQEGGAGDTTAVGSFAAELNGTVDIAGNVAEWTSSLYLPYPYVEFDGREEYPASGDRVFRGGSWAGSESQARSILRRPAQPSYADGEIGFRCALTP